MEGKSDERATQLVVICNLAIRFHWITQMELKVHSIFCLTFLRTFFLYLLTLFSFYVSIHFDRGFYKQEKT